MGFGITLKNKLLKKSQLQVNMGRKGAEEYKTLFELGNSAPPLPNVVVVELMQLPKDTDAERDVSCLPSHH